MIRWLKRLIITIFSIILFLVLAFCTLLAFPFSYCSFDKEKWLAVKVMNDHEYAQNKSEPRKCMMDDLNERYLKEGMPESEVIELLGIEERRVFYNPNDIKEFTDIKLPLTIESHTKLNAVMKPKQPYRTVDIFIAENGEPTQIKLNYNIGQGFADGCLLNITFDKQGLLTKKYFSCD